MEHFANDPEDYIHLLEIQKDLFSIILYDIDTHDQDSFCEYWEKCVLPILDKKKTRLRYEPDFINGLCTIIKQNFHASEDYLETDIWMLINRFERKEFREESFYKEKQTIRDYTTTSLQRIMYS